MDINERVQTQTRDPETCRLDAAPRGLALPGSAGAKWNDHPHQQDPSDIPVPDGSARLLKASVCMPVTNVARYACFLLLAIFLGSIRGSKIIRD